MAGVDFLASVVRWLGGLRFWGGRWLIESLVEGRESVGCDGAGCAKGVTLRFDRR